jgi:hypothetical protein
MAITLQVSTVGPEDNLNQIETTTLRVPSDNNLVLVSIGLPEKGKSSPTIEWSHVPQEEN